MANKINSTCNNCNINYKLRKSLKKKTVLLKLNRTVQVIPFITERKISNKKLQITNATQTLTGANEHKYTQTSLFSASTKLNCRFETIPTENAENVTFNVLYDTFSRRTTRD